MEKINRYYPVMIPTLNRYEHLKRLIESLACNTHAEETELFIGLDYPPSDKYVDGWMHIKKYLPTIKMFKKVNIIEHEHNLGAVKNLEFLKSLIFESYDALIFTEDDNEFSPCFLDYMNKGLQKYKDNPRVYSISGYRWNYLKINNLKSVFAISAFAAYGSGVWKNKVIDRNDQYYIDILLSPKRALHVLNNRPSTFSMLMNMVENNEVYLDIKYSIFYYLEDKVEIHPVISLVRNWGDDGSGLHSGSNNILHTQSISHNTTYYIDDIKLEDSKEATLFLKHFASSDMFILKYYYNYFKTFYHYAINYFKFKRIANNNMIN